MWKMVKEQKLQHLLKSSSLMQQPCIHRSCLFYGCMHLLNILSYFCASSDFIFKEHIMKKANFKLIPSHCFQMQKVLW